MDSKAFKIVKEANGAFNVIKKVIKTLRVIMAKDVP